MTNRKIRIEERPFRPKADRAREARLQDRYRKLAIPAVVAAIQMWGDTTVDKQVDRGSRPPHEPVAAAFLGLA
jgi:hypothetical protein